MALEIKPTPRLTGEAAKRFEELAREREQGISSQELQEAGDRLKKAFDFFNNPDFFSTKSR